MNSPSPRRLWVPLLLLAASCAGPAQDGAAPPTPPGDAASESQVPEPPETSGGQQQGNEATAPPAAPSEAVAPERLTARPGRGGQTTAPAGEQPLGVGDERDGLLYVPPDAGNRKLPLLVMLHGAGGNGIKSTRKLVPLAQELGFAIVAPESRGSSWSGFGEDVRYIDRALEDVFTRVRVDPERIALAGFSDGASFALSLGRPNGDLFQAVIAMSPGYMIDAPPVGEVPIYIHHGTRDPVLSFESASQRIVPQLRDQGYDVTFVQFDGKHELPPPYVRRAMQWWLDLG